MEHIRKFVERRREGVPCAVRKKTKMDLYHEMPNLRISVTYFDFLYEAEARELLGGLFEFSKTAALCLVLAEHYKFGYSKEFPELCIPTDLCRAAYWYVKAAAYGSKAAFDFFYRMVPECFLEDISQARLLSAVIETLIEQARWACAYPDETVEERKKREYTEGCMVDLILYPQEHELDDFFWVEFLQDQPQIFSRIQEVLMARQTKNSG